MNYEEALIYLFKRYVDFTSEEFDSLSALYWVLGPEELYDGIQTAAEDAGCEEWHEMALALMEEGI